MQFEQLRAFVRCADLGGLSAAARAENLPKSSLSRLLRQLEDVVGTPLMTRTSRGLRLTSEGRDFLEHARRILDDVERATVSVRAQVEQPCGVVRMTAPYTFGAMILSPLLPEFLARYPAVNLQIELTSRNLDLVEDGFDLAVRIGPPPPALGFQRLMPNPVCLMASPDYLARHGAPQRPEELGERALLMIGVAAGRRALTLQRGEQHIAVPCEPRLLSSDPAVVVRAALAGVGIGQIPLILVRDHIAQGELVNVLEEWSLPSSDIYLLFPNYAARAPRVEALIAYLTEHLGQV